MFRRIPRHYQNGEAEKALKAMDGFGMSTLTNTDDNRFWYVAPRLIVRYEHEKAKVGDHFYDGNNGDKHTVVAVDHDNQRIAVRNDAQNPELVDIVGW